MIINFADKERAAIAQGRVTKRLPASVMRVAARKLAMLHAAHDVKDLRVPPGNRLEQLQGDRAGQWSIRINDRYRIRFRWADGNAHDVEIVDYH